MNTGILVVYFVGYCYYMYAAIRQLRLLPYQLHRMANVYVRWQMRTVLIAFVMMIVSITLISFINYGSETGSTLLLVGLFPVQVRGLGVGDGVRTCVGGESCAY